MSERSSPAGIRDERGTAATPRVSRRLSASLFSGVLPVPWARE
jgi:hypothetical protein